MILIHLRGMYRKVVVVWPYYANSIQEMKNSCSIYIQFQFRYFRFLVQFFPCFFPSLNFRFLIQGLELQGWVLDEKLKSCMQKRKIKEKG